MTKEVAVQQLNVIYPYLNEESKQAIDTAIEALERQIPKRVERKNPYTDGSICECNNFILPYMKFCPKCGKGLEWSEEND